MKDKILEISDKLRKDVITIEEAESLLLGLFGVELNLKVASSGYPTIHYL